jgi:hypothetical protein
VTRGNALPDGVVEATHDQCGRLVLLRRSAMAHIVSGHPELDGHELAIVTAVENGTIFRGNKRGREIIYAPDLGPAPFLAVVVAYDGQGRGRVITAFGARRVPSGG